MKIYILLLAMMTFSVLSHAERIPRSDSYSGYEGNEKLTIAVKLSSATTDIPYFIGRSTVCVHIPEECRTALVCSLPSNTVNIWYGYEQNISTANNTPGIITSPGQATWCIVPGGYAKFENFMGNIYILNDNLSVSSSCVVVQRFIQDSDVK